ncbi:hypothetical protein PVAG01_07662 [Phlyctema vagabunda]|uniref:2EXR domain-containing protein n=1 Tax=Phlyctema vagabunda TaxID=108571 RepID=A0ABR4PD49_9HELO
MEDLIRHLAPPQTTDDLISLEEPARFAQFSELPRELRDMIWEFALPGPRYIELRFSTEAQEALEAWEPWHPWEEAGSPWEFFCQERVPTIFWACHEARETVERRCTQMGSTGLPLYTNLATDRFVISHKRFQSCQGDFASHLSMEFTQLIRHLVLDTPLRDLAGLRHFTNLETLAVAVDAKPMYAEDPEPLPEDSALDVVGFNNYLDTKRLIEIPAHVCGFDPGMVERENKQKRFAETLRAQMERWFTIFQGTQTKSWKIPELQVGQCILSERPGLEWELFDDHWYCSAEPAMLVSFFPRSYFVRISRAKFAAADFENLQFATREAYLDMIPSEDEDPSEFFTHVIKMPEFDYRCHLYYFPCSTNRFVDRASARPVKSLLDMDIDIRPVRNKSIKHSQAAKKETPKSILDLGLAHELAEIPSLLLPHDDSELEYSDGED